MDVVILAGGLGTRLHELWKGPKCLVPVDVVPLLQRLLDLLVPLNPQYVTLSLGVKAAEVQQFVKKGFSFPVACCVDPQPRGTTAALRRAVKEGYVEAPLLVLNGDTLPLYDLGALVQFHEQRLGAWATAAFAHDATAWRDIYAGACVLSAAALKEITADERTQDFSAHLLGAQRFIVPGFLDVGTPEGFQRAQEWRE